MDPYNDKDKVKQTDKLFFDKNDLSKQKVENLVNNTLNTYDGELFLENTESETFYFSDSRMQNISCNTSQGFGFRIIRDEVVGFSNFDKISFENLKRSSDTIRSIIKNENKSKTINHSYKYNKSIYIDENPITNLDFSHKLKLLNDINDYTRKLDNRVIQVSISLSGMLSLIQILKKDSEKHADIRPLVRLNIQVVVEENNLRSSGSSGCGGRTLYDQWVSRDSWEKQAKEALRLALINLHAKPAPAGEIPVVLGPGWPGVMLHEAVGHGLEGDFNRKGTSIYSNKIGTRVAAKGVDVFDNGTIKNRRGSITIDDEGIPSSKNLLIKDGILIKYMQDIQNANLTNTKPTGNGRRESFAHHPMPRMTNTYLGNGKYQPEEIIKSVKRGIYAVNFGGGQVDITSGKFVFSASEAYMIENGKIKFPIKGATLIGNGTEAMHKIKMIGNNLKLDDGIGTCGKNGQGVPVGVGQPTLLMNGITVGGTKT